MFGVALLLNGERLCMCESQPGRSVLYVYCGVNSSSDRYPGSQK